MDTIARPERITRGDAEEVALAAYAQLFDLLDRLRPDAWDAPTDCARWDVEDVVGHLLGAARSNASTRELVRQQAWGRRHASEFDGNPLDAVNQLQVREHEHLAPAEKVARLRALAPRAAHRRTHGARPLRALPVPLGLTTGSAMPGLQRSIRLGRLNEVVYTRDVWLHTLDLERATGTRADRTGDVDRRVVHDAVADWLALHGAPVRLELTGPAGGTFAAGEGGPTIRLDALEWARTVSGRAPGEGLLAQPVVF